MKELIERGWDGQVKPVILGSGDESKVRELFDNNPILNAGTYFH